MEITRIKDGRLSREKLKKLAYVGRKKCLMKKAWELSVLCGNPLCVILYNSKRSGQAETWPKDIRKVNSVIYGYQNAIASKRRSEKNINMTLQDLKLSHNKWAEASKRSPVKKVWEMEFPRGFITELPFQKLAAINEKIDATLRKIDDAMLRASAKSSQAHGDYPKTLVPCKVDTFEALMQQDKPIYWNQHQSGNETQMMSAYDSNTAKSNIVRMLMSDQFGGQSSSSSNNTWHTSGDESSNNQVDVSQNQYLLPSSAVSKEVFNQQLLLCANPFDHFGCGALDTDYGAEFSGIDTIGHNSINSCGNQDLFDHSQALFEEFDWNPSDTQPQPLNSLFDQPQPQPAGDQMQMQMPPTHYSYAWDCYPQRTMIDGDGCNTCIFDTSMNGMFM